MNLSFIRITIMMAAIFAGSPVNAVNTTQEMLVESHYPLIAARVFEFQSERAGRKYRIMVSLPGSYDTSGDGTRYPVLYTVDGQWHFPIAQAAIGGLYYDRGARESIVVGITWMGDEDNANRLRVEDFTPTNTDSPPGSGKADKYLDFLQFELIPYMAENYRTSDDRTLSGSSFGGLLTLYCLFTRPSVFTDYLASTPAIWWDEGAIRKFQKTFSEKELRSPARLYVARGEMEYAQTGIDAFVDELKAENYRNLEIEFDVIKGAGHGGLNPEAFTRGVQYIFKKKRIHLDDKQVARLTGSYKGPADWPEVEVGSTDGRLYSRDSQTNKNLQWVTVNENLFYIANTGAEVSFSVNENKGVTQMNLNVESGVISFEKKAHD